MSALNPVLTAQCLLLEQGEADAGRHEVIHGNGNGNGNGNHATMIFASQLPSFSGIPILIVNRTRSTPFPSDCLQDLFPET